MMMLGRVSACVRRSGGYQKLETGGRVAWRCRGPTACRVLWQGVE